MGGCIAGGDDFDDDSDQLTRDLSKKNVENWKPHHVGKWYKIHKFPKEFEESFSQINGKELESMDESKLIEMQIFDLTTRRNIMYHIEDLIEKRRFNQDEFAIFSKIKVLTKDTKSGSWKYLVQSLSNKKEIKKTYLNSMMLKDALEKFLPDMKDDYEDYESLVDPDMENITVDLREVPRSKMKLPIKLVITENEESKNAKNFLSPVFKRLPMLNKTASFHSAIIVGSFWLEFGESGLCVPKKLQSDMALISADIDTTSVLREMTIDEIIDKLSDVICFWNTKMEYSETDKTDGKKGNSQDFVDAILEKLGISINQSGALQRYFTRMKKTGKCQMVFDLSKKFQEHFNFRMKSVQFDTHSELDNFVRKCEEENACFEVDWREEYQLLKAFDRAMWLRHFKRPGVQKYKPTNCPFNDPRSTRSLICYC